MIAAKLEGRDYRGDGSGLIRSILANSPAELTELIPGRPAPGSGPSRTADQCSRSDPHARHFWEDRANAYVCFGQE